jgi:Ring hydroxylating alpha subunit (catalytic domain)
VFAPGYLADPRPRKRAGAFRGALESHGIVVGVTHGFGLHTEEGASCQDYLRWPASLDERERPPQRGDLQGGTSLGVVLDPDLYNLPRVQAGMRSRAFTGLLLSAQERRIRHFHRTLDEYLGAGATG